MRKKTYTVGLTGGIASGKTAASNHFKNLGVPIIDADIIARKVVEPNTLGLKKIVDEFSESILKENGELNRKELRKTVFNNPQKLEKLNSILHPMIRQSIHEEIQRIKSGYCIVVIPLLCESEGYEWLDRILVVDVKESTQITRLISRDEISEELAKKMLAQQCSRQKRLKIADDIIANDTDLRQLYDNVENLHLVYQHL